MLVMASICMMEIEGSEAATSSHNSLINILNRLYHRNLEPKRRA